MHNIQFIISPLRKNLLKGGDLDTSKTSGPQAHYNSLHPKLGSIDMTKCGRSFILQLVDFILPIFPITHNN